MGVHYTKCLLPIPPNKARPIHMTSASSTEIDSNITRGNLPENSEIILGDDKAAPDNESVNVIHLLGLQVSLITHFPLLLQSLCIRS